MENIILNITPYTGLPQGAVTSCTLFNLYINNIIGELHHIPGIQCLLYADDLIFWTQAHKRKTEEKTEQILNKALATHEEWCERNYMKLNTAKTTFHSLSLAQNQFIQG